MGLEVIELEAFLVFFSAIFFTLIYLGKREPLWGVITYGCWQVTAFMWINIVPIESTYSVALFFQGIAIMFLLMTVLQWLNAFKNRNLEPSELD